MGKFEVLGYLTTQRVSGDDAYYRYGEIHERLRSQGISLSYTSVWRSVNSLFSDELLEVEWDGGVLQRTAKFRARLPSNFQGSDMKRVHNTYRGLHQGSGRAIPGEPLAVARRRPAAVIAAGRRV